jgi:hypothetical protein
MKKIKKLLSIFTNRMFIYSFISSYLSNMIGFEIAHYSLPLGLLAALILLIGIFLVLCSIDLLIFENKEEISK